MTDRELDELTAPVHYKNLAASTPTGRGLVLSDIEAGERWHVCGNCRQPITNRGREDCKNNKEMRG